MSDFVEIVEVGPRDGLQNEANAISTSQKVALIDLLGKVGFRRIEAASFVSPNWVPQMAGSDEVMARITRAPGVRYGALTPNIQGYIAAHAAKVDEVAIFASASEGFSRANINATIEESLDRFRPVAARAHEDGLPMRGYISCVVECPYDGLTAPANVCRVAEDLLEMGCFELSLGDTLGRARPDQISSMLEAVLSVVPSSKLAGHFHDTAGRALDNVDAAMKLGLRVFDGSAGGLGGCPYAPDAAGNVATEALVEHLNGLGIDHGLDRMALTAASEFARALRREQTT